VSQLFDCANNSVLPAATKDLASPAPGLLAGLEVFLAIAIPIKAAAIIIA
jgi:hypothetical protein